MQLTIATRDSDLALWQANYVKRLLEEHHLQCKLLPIKTDADKHLLPLHDLGGKGLFVKSIQNAVLAGKADIAVHSAKDLPCKTVEGLVLAAVPKRGYVEDVLIADKKLTELPINSQVATGSPRRKMQLLHLNPNIEVVAIRGNIVTRIAKWRQGEVAGVVLAKAGLARLKMLKSCVQEFTISEILPAAGQGCLAVECLSSNLELQNILQSIDHKLSHEQLIAERSCLEHLGGHCFAPIAAFANFVDGKLHLTAKVGRRKIIEAALAADNAYVLGQMVADDLNKQGAQELIND